MKRTTSLTAEQIDEFFDTNADELEAEGTYALSPWIRSLARAQVQLYWKRLRRVAEQVTDTEVRLQLPAQRTPEGREFAIEGIVDIVREEDGTTTMYDIKTHDADYVRNNREQYEKQLNVYAHIWTKLRHERLDGTAVICTTLPDEVEDAYSRQDEVALKKALDDWDPVIPIDYDAERVERTVNEFAKAVDNIESHEFAPHATSFLRKLLPGTRRPFAVYVCVNCDARYSCRSYQRYALGSNRKSENAVRQYLSALADDDAQEAFTLAALDVDAPLADT
jgi:hypothetical protein